MLRLYLTRLVLPLIFVAAMMAIPFVWLPDVKPPAGDAPAVTSPSPRHGGVVSPAPGKESARAGRPRPGPLQRAMTMGFALILVSVTVGGAMLYSITRQQTASWQRRFAPRRKGDGDRKSDRR